MWDVRDVGCSGCGMLGMWDVRDVGCSGCGMFGVWDVQDVGCSRCGMFGMWNVQDVGCSGCGMCRNVGCAGCGMFRMWDVWDVGCGMFVGMWDVDLQNALLIVVSVKLVSRCEYLLRSCWLFEQWRSYWWFTGVIGL